MTDKDLINKLNRIADNISVDSSWKEQNKAELLATLPGIPQDQKPPKDLSKVFSGINALKVVALLVSTGILSLAAGVVIGNVIYEDELLSSQKYSDIYQNRVTEIQSITDDITEAEVDTGSEVLDVSTRSAEIKKDEDNIRVLGESDLSEDESGENDENSLINTNNAPEDNPIDKKNDTQTTSPAVTGDTSDEQDSSPEDQEQNESTDKNKTNQGLHIGQEEEDPSSENPGKNR